MPEENEWVSSTKAKPAPKEVKKAAPKFNNNSNSDKAGNGKFNKNDKPRKNDAAPAPKAAEPAAAKAEAPKPAAKAPVAKPAPAPKPVGGVISGTETFAERLKRSQIEKALKEEAEKRALEAVVLAAVELQAEKAAAPAPVVEEVKKIEVKTVTVTDTVIEGNTVSQVSEVEETITRVVETESAIEIETQTVEKKTAKVETLAAVEPTFSMLTVNDTPIAEQPSNINLGVYQSHLAKGNVDTIMGAYTFGPGSNASNSFYTSNSSQSGWSVPKNDSPAEMWTAPAAEESIFSNKQSMGVDNSAATASTGVKPPGLDKAPGADVRNQRHNGKQDQHHPAGAQGFGHPGQNNNMYGAPNMRGFYMDNYPNPYNGNPAQSLPVPPTNGAINGNVNQQGVNQQHVPQGQNPQGQMHQQQYQQFYPQYFNPYFYPPFHQSYRSYPPRGQNGSYDNNYYDYQNQYQYQYQNDVMPGPNNANSMKQNKGPNAQPNQAQQQADHNIASGYGYPNPRGSEYGQPWYGGPANQGSGMGVQGNPRNMYPNQHQQFQPNQQYGNRGGANNQNAPSYNYGN